MQLKYKLNVFTALQYVLIIIFLMSTYYYKTQKESLQMQIDSLRTEYKITTQQLIRLRNTKLEVENNNTILKEYKTQIIAYENTVKTLLSFGIPPRNYKLPEKVSRGSYEINKKHGKLIGEFVCTYYAPNKEECGNNKGITRSGRPIIPSETVAIDNNFWKFGTKFYIETLGIAVEATDTGSDIKGKYRMDIATFSKDVSDSGRFTSNVYLIN